MDLELRGRTAVVTGCSVGIGREIARVLAAEGVPTLVVARRGDLLKSLQDQIEAAGWVRPHALAVDLADRAAPARVRDEARARLGQVDILVNNAGGSRPTAVDAADDVWDDSFAINFTAVRKLTQALLPGMIDRGWGRVINVTGTSEPGGTNAAGPAKAAVHAWAKGLSRDVGRHGITVNCLAPGRIHSEATPVPRCSPSRRDVGKEANMVKTIRRVVTGHDARGKSMIVSDGPSPHVLLIPGRTDFGLTNLWVSDGAPGGNEGNADAAARPVVLEPPAGGTIFRVVEFPPDKAADFDRKMAFSSMGAGHTMDPDASRHPGMHKTDTVDYAIVLSGEIWALMDEGETRLDAGDCLVQRGTNHAWANRSDQPCLVAFILVSAT